MTKVSTLRPPAGGGVSRGLASEPDAGESVNRQARHHLVQIPGRGRVFVKEFPGPIGAPTVALLHGWTATADLNWQSSYRSLSQHFNVLAFDHHGHGRGVRVNARFRLEDCADDVAAIAADLDIDRLIVAGYSMGGPIASLVWRRHRQLVDGLVMCATSHHFCDSRSRKAFFSLVNGSAHLSGHRHLRALGKLPASAWSRRLQRRGGAAGVVEQSLGHDWTRIFEAGAAIGKFDSRPWTDTINVPTSVIATLDDVVVPTEHQFELAAAISGATLLQVSGGHTACADAAGRFSSELLHACRSVAERAAAAKSASILIAPAAS
ncbi:MAG: alpha/beta fold hydrolase [Ilumatobacter sp.]